MTIDIQISQGHAPPLSEADAYIVIDVIRAFTTTQIAFEQGASRVLLAREVEEARALKDEFPEYLLAGERNALKIDGFDLGNSPFACASLDFAGRGMILTTTNGVRATLHALGFAHRSAAPVIVSGFGSAAASAQLVRDMVLSKPMSERIGRVHIIASHPTGDEDVACAEYIRALILQDGSVTADEVSRRIFDSDAAQKFLDPTRPKYDARDVEICAHPPAAGFAMLVVDHPTGPMLVRRGADDGRVDFLS